MKRFSERRGAVDHRAAAADGVGFRAGGAVDDRGEVASLRDAIDDFRLDADLRGVALDVDQRRLRRDLHRLGDARDRQREVDLQGLPEVHLDVGGFLGVEALKRGRHFVDSRAAATGSGRHRWCRPWSTARRRGAGCGLRPSHPAAHRRTHPSRLLRSSRAYPAPTRLSSSTGIAQERLTSRRNVSSFSPPQRMCLELLSKSDEILRVCKWLGSNG